MEKSINSYKSAYHSYSSSEMLTVVTGFSLFWACLFIMLIRNTFLDTEIEQLWYRLILRIAFCVGFGVAAFIVSRVESGKSDKSITRFMLIFTIAFAVSALGVSLIHTALGIHPILILDLIVWSFSGMTMSYLLFFWIPVISHMDEPTIARCIAFSAACGGGISFLINLLPPFFNSILLALCPALSFLVRQIIVQEKTWPSLLENSTVSYEVSKKNASLSWSFGIIYIMYGIVLGLGVGLITQLTASSLLLIGIAVSLLIGAAAAALFMHKFAGKIGQMDVLRMLFPFLVAPLLIMSLFTGLFFTLSNFLLLADYVFLIAISVAFETQIANSQHASPLFVVGMSQGALNTGMAAGFLFSLLPSTTNVINSSTLATVALALVMLLAIVIIFAPPREIVADIQQNPANHESGHWKACCAIVAQNAGLSPRETEVFFLLAKGRSIDHIQNKLCISVHTVKTHVYNIYQKMGISSREELLDAVDAAKDATPVSHLDTHR